MSDSQHPIYPSLTVKVQSEILKRACDTLGQQVQPHSEIACQHQMAFDQGMREALDYVCAHFGTKFAKDLQTVHDMWPKNKKFHFLSIDSVDHFQENVLYKTPGYRNIRWTRKSDSHTRVTIQDVFWAEPVARNYHRELNMILKAKDEGVITVCKWQVHNIGRRYTEKFDDSLTYEGHPVNTGAEVLALVRHLGDLPCMQING